MTVACFSCDGSGFVERESGNAATPSQIAEAVVLPNDELGECLVCEGAGELDENIDYEEDEDADD